MASFTSVMVGMFEEQAALLMKHIAVLKANDSVAQTVAADAGPQKKVGKTGKISVPKAAVDPNLPKKGLTAYHLYLGENQAPFKASNPTMTQADIMATLGRRWTALTPEGKDKFVKLAAVAKVSQQDKIDTYLATKGTSSSSSVPVVVKAPKVKAAKDVAAPAEAALAAPVAAPKTPIASPKPAAATPVVVFSPEVVTATTSGTEEKEHKKKKKRKSEAAEEAAPVSAVIEALPVAVPEEEKKKKKSKKSKTADAEAA